MTPALDGGLVVDAQVRRGAFTLAVSFAVEPGEVLAVLGPNGAGKSTLLGALAGLIPVASGRISLDGRVRRRRRHGHLRRGGRPTRGLRVPGLPAVPPPERAGQRRLRGPRPRRPAATRPRPTPSRGWTASAWPAWPGAGPADLSGGQAQRVALARALAARPALLLLDEPLSALDARTRLDVQAELKRHLADFAGPVLLVTHDPLEALVLADRLLVLEDGRVVQEGAPAEVARRPATDYVARLVGLNLYAGTADGAQVALAGGGTFTVPDLHAARRRPGGRASVGRRRQREPPRGHQRPQHLAGHRRRA